MCDFEQVLRRVLADERYQRNLDWGKPRKGHPEGTVRQHIRELEENLESLRSKLSSEDAWKLKVLIHIHDTLKAESKHGVPIIHSRSHASIAREFLADYCDDKDLLNMVQLHDEPYALWRKYQNSGLDEQRLGCLLETISDWKLFLTFLIVDGCTEGKSREPLLWFFGVIEGRVTSAVTVEWLL